jgi:hypothetical protein
VYIYINPETKKIQSSYESILDANNNSNYLKTQAG